MENKVSELCTAGTGCLNDCMMRVSVVDKVQKAGRCLGFEAEFTGSAAGLQDKGEW